MPDERHLQKEGLIREDFEPPVVSISSRPQAELGVSPRVLVDESRHAELLGKSQQLTARCRSLHEIHEVCLHATFGEEAQRLPRVRTLLHAEYLNVHARGNR